jgi:SAM-dependent methyltransferase
MTSRKLRPRLWEPTFLLNRALVRSLRRLVPRHFPPDRVGRILDVGCGSMPYRGLFPQDSYLGCDIDPASPAVASCPADALAFPDRSFDAVVAFQLLEHVTEPWRVMGEIARVLRPGGKALITVPFLFPFHASPQDYFRYTHQGVAELAAASGFRLVEVDGQCPLAQMVITTVNMKLVERLGGLRKFPPVRPLHGIAERSLLTLSNTFGLIFPANQRLLNGDGQWARIKSYPDHANYVAVLEKPASLEHAA